MPKTSELALYANLFEVTSLDTILREGLPAETIKTDELRIVYLWALDYYERNGRKQAPTQAAMEEIHGDMLSDAEISWDGTEAEPIEWVIDTLKAQHAYWKSQQFTRKFATDMSEADNSNKLNVLAEGSDELFAIASDLKDQSVNKNALEGVEERWIAYQELEGSGQQTQGMRLNLPVIDEHLYGIHAGELALLAAGPKIGKSFFLVLVALWEWLNGRATALFTLENTTAMTLDRICCIGSGVSYRNWQRGELTATDKEQVHEFRARIRGSDVPFRIIQPQPGQRTMAEMVREARNFGVQSLLIDQLTFVEHPDPKSKGRPEIIRDIMHSCKNLINPSQAPMSCLLAHQINREGVKAADKDGRLEMYHMSEGAEAERTADFVFGLYQGKRHRDLDVALLQLLAARRTDIAEWLLTWMPFVGNVAVRATLDLPTPTTPAEFD